ncbi:thiolase family protein, partial [Actinokineospora sp.]|uniref:thiolase family protein n=1 Tax=Actinokineospora sp. TaxID=1872133 RepID=UPI003D6C2EA4
MTRDVFVLDGVRTPFGRYGGGLSGARPDDLGAHVLRALAERSGLDPAIVGEVVLGAANQAGEDNRNVARMAALLAGWPTSVPGTTVNRLCGSSMDAVMQASRTIAVGDASLAVAGGVESMSRAPWVLLKPAKGFPAGPETLHSTTLGWRMVNPKMPAGWTVSLGAATEQLAERYGIDRERQDAFALRSHQLAAKAWDNGFYDDHVVPVPATDLTRDEGIRPDTTLDKLSTLKPAFREAGTVTAGNSSPLNDGASALLLGDQTAADRLGVTPLA